MKTLVASVEPLNSLDVSIRGKNSTVTHVREKLLTSMVRIIGNRAKLLQLPRLDKSLRENSA
jgi:hypothetical protein